MGLTFQVWSYSSLSFLTSHCRPQEHGDAQSGHFSSLLYALFAFTVVAISSDAFIFQACSMMRSFCKSLEEDLPLTAFVILNHQPFSLVLLLRSPFPSHSFGTPWTTSLGCEKWPLTPIFNKLLILGGLFHFPHTILELEKSEEKSHWWIHDKFLLKTFLMLLQQLLKYIPKKVSPQHTTVPGDDISCLPSFSISCSCRCLQWLFLSPWDVSNSMPSVYPRWGQSSALSSEERKVA